MSDIETIIGLVVVALLGAYLYFKHCQRTYSAPEPRQQRQWTGHPIDAENLKQQVEKVRVNYLAARGARKGACFHRSLLGLARRAVAGLAFFRDRRGNGHAGMN
jgi:hypothetical protein